MATWGEFAAEAPELADTARSILDGHRHKTIATLRKDGAPRISGIEAEVTQGQVWIGSMPDAVKGRDLLRDPRCALHSGSAEPSDDDPAAWPGDAKLSGRAVSVTDAAELQRYLDATGARPPGPFDLFRIDLDEVVVTRVAQSGDRLVIEWWRPGQGVRRVERA